MAGALGSEYQKKLDAFRKKSNAEKVAALRAASPYVNQSSGTSTPTNNTPATPTPKSGVGGVNYATVNVNQQRLLEIQRQKELNDAKYRQDEINRTLSVIKGRKSQGLDTAAQRKYLTSNLGYTGNDVDLSPNPVIPTPTPTPTPATTVPVATTPTNNTPATPTPTGQSQAQLEAQMKKDREETTALIMSLENARKQKALADLQKSRDAALSNLSGEQAAIQPQFTDARNQAAARSTQAARNFAEFMAARGGTRSGANAQAELSRGATLQGNLGSLDRQENAALADIERRRSGISNAYESDVASANAGIDADSMNQLLDAFYRAQERGDTLTQRLIQNEFTRAGLTGTLDGELTLAGRDQAFNQDLARDQFDLAVRRQDFTEAQQDWLNRFNYGQAIGQFSNGQKTLAKQQFDENVRQFGVEQALKQAGIEQDAKQAAAAQGLQWAQLEQRRKEAIAEQTYNDKYLDIQESKANSTPETKQTISEIEAGLVAGFDSVPIENRKTALEQEKGTIVSQIGLTGYNRLYNLYIDQYGDPIE